MTSWPYLPDLEPVEHCPGGRRRVPHARRTLPVTPRTILRHIGGAGGREALRCALVDDDNFSFVFWWDFDLFSLLIIYFVEWRVITSCVNSVVYHHYSFCFIGWSMQMKRSRSPCGRGDVSERHDVVTRCSFLLFIKWLDKVYRRDAHELYLFSYLWIRSRGTLRTWGTRTLFRYWHSNAWTNVRFLCLFV